ncbi:MAG: signal peptidase I [Candidatus Eremiobacteraeota bacterium]|nr:signal peptidase I [Candidatus Eremiobacteraeota bacterium]
MSEDGYVLSSNRLRSAANIAWQVAVLAIIAFAVMGLRPGQVSGYSMRPRIDSDEYVLINALAYRLGTPQRGDIVAFRHERSAQAVYLKRVIGVPGDRISIDRGSVIVNGAALAEPYVGLRDARSFAAVVVPRDAYYVLGDNRANSDDSRVWGFVPANDLIGRALFGVWPPAHFGVLS